MSRPLRYITSLAAILLLLPFGGWSAEGGLVCADGAPPHFGAQFADLHQSLGDVMGAPAGCLQTDAEGNAIQMTSTGVAIVRSSGLVVFASGDHHWALSRDGLESWTGNWHNGFDPPVGPAPPLEDADQTPPDQLAQVQAVTVRRLDQENPNVLMVEDAVGHHYRAQTDGRCPDAWRALGGRAYLSSLGPVGVGTSVLISLEQHQTCALSGLEPAAN
jgi:hypothetical protein